MDCSRSLSVKKINELLANNPKPQNNAPQHFNDETSSPEEKATPYQYRDANPIQLINRLADTLSALQTIEQETHKALQFYDLATSDLLHEIEFRDTCDADIADRTYTTLKQLRDNRRTASNVMRILNPLYILMGNYPTLIGELEKAITNAQTNASNQNDRSYAFRTNVRIGG